MSDLFYDPRDDLGAVSSDYTSRDDDPDIDHVPQNRHRYLTEAERQAIENADMVERQQRDHWAALYYAEFGILDDSDDERYPSETERDWHPESAP